jgi:hypothetical protein
MSKDKVITIDAKVIEARHDFTANEIIIKLESKGKRMAARLNAEAIFGQDVDTETMRQYADLLSRRKLPLKLEVLESQLEEDKEKE